MTPQERLERENARLKAEVQTLRKFKQAHTKSSATYDQFIAELKDTLKAENKTQHILTAAPIEKIRGKASPEIVCAALSDLHLTETVRPDDSCGINEYDSVICANRLYEYADTIERITKLHSNMYPIKGMWIPVLGDIISGSIHNDQLMYNDLSDPAAVILGSRLIEMFLRKLSGMGLPIAVDCIHGNHPRTTPKMPAKRQAHTNLDWQLYEVVKDKLGDDKQFDIVVHTSQIGTRKLFDWTYMFEHGIAVSAGGEEDLEDRLRAIFDDATYRSATGLTGASFDQLVIGNTHKAKFLERTIVNGTLVGQNELGMSWRLKPVKAIQNMWGVSKGRVRTWNYQVDVTDIKSKGPDNAFSEYAVWFLKKYRR